MSRLPDLALAALADGQALRAFAMSDRWRRVAGEHPANLLARADASKMMGHSAFALADVLRGLEFDPLNRALNYRLAEWGDDAQREQAARTLLGLSRMDIAKGLRILALRGFTGAGAVSVSEDRATGWAAWGASSSAELRIDGANSRWSELKADPSHAWAGFFGCAAEFSIDLSGSTALRIRLFVGDAEVARASPRSSPVFAADRPLPCSPETVTVIVPVYDDFEATRACLESLTGATADDPDTQILAVEDDSPEPRMRSFLTEFGRSERRHVRFNAQNLGFVGTVNRALQMVPHGDVLLLNADTLTPAGFVERFRRIARSDPTIGTINPLSNHGEFVSFPKPFRQNDLDKARWRRLDRTAAAVNAGRIVDIPSGTGFCVYISRACLDAIGGLSADYVNGYLEDADFGLRARQAGFRNICAPSIFVPHLGSRSFKSQKAALVARNRATLFRRFPDYGNECDAFVAMDPLADARARIEIHDAPICARRRLILGPARLREALEVRATQIEERGGEAIVATFGADCDGWGAKLTATGGRMPQNVRIPYTGDAARFCGELFRWPHDRVELLATNGLPAELAASVAESRAPVDLLVAEAPVRHEFAGRRLIGLDAMSRAACHPEQSAPTPVTLGPSARDTNGGGALGVVLPFETPEILRLLLKMAEQAEAFDCPVFVLGATSVDENLIARGLFVTGAIAAAERTRIVEQYGVRRLFLPYRHGCYWAVEAYRKILAAPAAYFDWSQTSFREDCRDLQLAPSIDDDEVISGLIGWLSPENTYDTSTWAAVWP